ncbi:MAG: PilT/PilU family type 4a pilus ATPase [Actinomycetota bacterium]
MGEVLIDERLISREQLQEAMERQRVVGKPLGKILLEMGAVTEDSLVEAVARQIGIPYIDLVAYPPPANVATLLPRDLALKLSVVPVELRGNELLVAMAEPTNHAALREVAEITGYECKPALAVKQRITDTIEAYAVTPRDSYGDVLQPVVGTPPAHAETPEEKLNMHDLLTRLVDDRGSDLHLTADSQPVLRINGSLQRLDDYPVLTPGDLRRMIYSILTQKQRETLERELELDLSYGLPGKARFRVNVYFQRDAIGAAVRLIPFEIKSLEQLGVPRKVADFAGLPRGLVLVTGPTGSGKSTTLAAVVDIANSEREDHILTVEDPIEYLHRHKRALVNQREVGGDTHTFADALKHALRQDPDIILVGEMRDLETIQTALTAAETGHLVFATLHTQSAPEAVDRVIDVFPPHAQQQIRIQLAATIQGIVTQQLLKTADGVGRVVACEILIATPAIRNLIREGKTHMIYSSMQAGGAFGMQTIEQALADLVKKRVITFETGLERCQNPEDYARLAGRS